ncbi:hypothetical protein G4177_36200 [Corallococcus sp. ZKHCc1 1396]|uniref:DUF1080 domain-containing protein n=1 Tax=Corallococcus soli TaxID=2710757 RepID=A0ABR9Q0A1_9BACT|nr:hypothetical protein [Corallococcus soli]MBE4753604.1 hypothetical protein [Corallococcus soli]
MNEERRRWIIALGSSAVLILWAGGLLFSHGACNGPRDSVVKPTPVAPTPQALRDTPSPTDALEPVPLERIQVTQGNVVELQRAVLGGTHFGIEVPRQRAVAPETTGDDVGLRFTWLGITEPVIPLASGVARQQVGLKLRAQDGCNVIYAMWRIAPSAGIVVNYKRNPDDRESGECGNAGYTTVRPRFMEPLDLLAQGEPHELRARIDADVLTVYADGKRVWEGVLPADALTLQGPAGMRTDNARVRFELLVPRETGTASRR